MRRATIILLLTSTLKADFSELCLAGFITAIGMKVFAGDEE